MHQRSAAAYRKMPVYEATLGTMPTEIRLLVLSFFVKDWNFAPLLRVCRKFESDFTASILGNINAVFTIEPKLKATSIELQLDGDQDRSCRRVRFAGIHPQRHPFRTAPLYKFNSITIIVLAPDVTDPGQFLRTWRTLTGLTQFISPTTSLNGPLKFLGK